MNDAGWCWWWTMNDDNEYQAMCHVWQTIVLIRMLGPVEMYLPCRVCLWNKKATRQYCWCSWQMTSSEQMTLAAKTRTEALTPREAVTSKCVHTEAVTEELSPYRIRSLQDSTSTSSTAWTMVTMTIVLPISAVACIANMERHWNKSWKGVASDAAQWSFSHLNLQASRCIAASGLSRWKEKRLT